ncbi:MAG: DUF4328 domain-containing protein [Proteobacteria bacterium]|nr:DUF4328 domain-containing protein [Pseudomonadota bacterium]
MSIKKIIGFSLLGLWLILSIYLSVSTHSWVPVIYMNIAPIPVVVLIGLIVWGIRLCFKKKEAPAIQVQYVISNTATFQNSTVLTFSVIILAIVEVILFLLMINFQEIHKIVLLFILGVLVRTACLWIWFYKTNFNAHYLGAKGMKYSPGDAIVWSIIPFGIYFVLRELWKTSFTPSDQWEKQKNPILLKIWWTLIWASVICAVYQKHNLFHTLHVTFFTISMCLFVAIVYIIYKKQLFHYKNIQAPAAGTS